ncbi:MAG: L-lactate permease, partial [Terriglobia bacterium]
MTSNHSASVAADDELKVRSSAFSSAALLACVAALALGAVYLLASNPSAGHWAQSYDPLGRWWLSTMLAALPIAVLLSAMAVLRIKAHLAACAGLLTAMAVATIAFHMPVRIGSHSRHLRRRIRTFPVGWIILPVIYLYDLTVKTGSFDALQASLANVTDDGRLQVLLIAFALEPVINFATVSPMKS